MPRHGAGHDTTTDEESPCRLPAADRQDNFGSARTVDVAAFHSFRAKSASLVTNRNNSTPSDAGLDDARPSGEDSSQAALAARLARDGPEQAHGGDVNHPIETSIWDWETPLSSTADSTSSLYEPQGELLRVDRDQGPTQTEFTTPYAVHAPSSNWSFPNKPSTSNGHTAFTLPRPPPGVPPAIAGNKRKLTSETPARSKQPDQKRSNKIMSDTGEDPSSPAEGSASARPGRSTTPWPQNSREGSEPQQRSESDPARSQAASGSGQQRGVAEATSNTSLPARKVFPIQVGDKLFRLSGASISSDAPSYFSHFFEEQLRINEGADQVRTLYIDRDPATFEDISLHLQGYQIEPRDSTHFVRLFADAQFFSLPRLTAQLFSSPIYIRIGDEEFQIPRDLFSSPGDSPNYFSLGFSVFFTSPNEVFPGLSRRALLRPPSILPPSIPGRSAKTFVDLLHVLRGYPVDVRSEKHRQELLRDARYFHLKGLEQRLIPHHISYNLARKKTEILIRLEDIRQSGVSFVADNASANVGAAPSISDATATSPEGAGSAAGTAPSTTTTTTATASTAPPSGPGWVHYQRPYVDSEPYSLILEIAGDEETYLALAPASVSATARIGRANFFRSTLARITSLFSVVANKMNLPVTQPLGLMMMERGAGVASLPVSPGNTGVSEERVKVRIGLDADVVLDGKPWSVLKDQDQLSESGSEMEVDQSSAGSGPGARPGHRKRRKRGGGSTGAGGGGAGADDDDDGDDWIIKKSQWRMRVQPNAGGVASGRGGMEIILGAVKVEAYSDERRRNAQRGFLV